MSMSNVIKYPIKFYLFDLILCITTLVISVFGFFTLLDSNVLWAVLYAMIFLISAVGLFFAICDIQWIKIDAEYISAYNIFGLIKRLEISKIQTVVEMKADTFGWKTLRKSFSCIVLSCRKSKSSVDNAFNKKKNSYIILPYSEENKLVLEKFNLPLLKNPHSS